MIGLFVLTACHSACVSCSGAGSDLCLECKVGYHRNDLNQCVGQFQSALFASHYSSVAAEVVVAFYWIALI